MNKFSLIFSICVICCAGLLNWRCQNLVAADVSVRPSIEDLKPDGDPYSPSTQSFLRGKHWLETTDGLRIEIDGDHKGRVTFKNDDARSFLRLENVPMNVLVPRLHYVVGEQPDEFDAFNLMMAEFSRNSVSLPVGKQGDEIAHFQSGFEESVPWTLKGDYQFEANPLFRPLRVSIINNCLASGLWELNAVDRAGEIFHAWFDMPPNLYTNLVAEVNGVTQKFADQSLAWHERPVEMDLDRLRTVVRPIDDLNISRKTGEVGYSTQGSRRKLAKGYVGILKDGEKKKPQFLDDFLTNTTVMSDFIPPGKYSITKDKTFDFSYLNNPKRVSLRQVKPHTSYAMTPEAEVDHGEAPHLEMEIHLVDGRSILIGNLPYPLLVQQEDFPINGFGVGILSASDPAERRAFRIEEGHAPSFAYLVSYQDGKPYAINNHNEGLEQIFIRTRPFDDEPHWEIIISSFERMVDLVKYKVPIPAEMVQPMKDASMNYVSPLYTTYKDDNLR